MQPLITLFEQVLARVQRLAADLAELEAQVQAVHLQEPDHRTFYDAFCAKQQPRFSGETRRDQPTGEA